MVRPSIFGGGTFHHDTDGPVCAPVPTRVEAVIMAQSGRGIKLCFGDVHASWLQVRLLLNSRELPNVAPFKLSTLSAGSSRHKKSRTYYAVV